RSRSTPPTAWATAPSRPRPTRWSRSTDRQLATNRRRILRRSVARTALQVLARRDPLDGAAALGRLVVALGDERADVDDPLALLARDLRPVVGVGRVREVLVLLELLADRREEVVGTDAPLAFGDGALDRQLLGPAHDVLDHGARGEVLEEHHLLVAVLVR